MDSGIWVDSSKGGPGRNELELDTLVSMGNTYPAPLRWHLAQYPELVIAWEGCQTAANALPAAQKAAEAASEKVGSLLRGHAGPRPAVHPHKPAEKSF